jgi:hypothetical protein
MLRACAAVEALFYRLAPQHERCKAQCENTRMAMVELHELESAINWWRSRAPAAGMEYALTPEVAALAKPYALLIWSRAGSVSTEQLSDLAIDALQSWRAAQPSPVSD